MPTQERKPRLGDKRFVGLCTVCGGRLWETFKQFPVYHNDTEERWAGDGHDPFRNPAFCIQELAARIASMDERLKDAGL